MTDERPLPDGWRRTTIGSITLPVDKAFPKDKPSVRFTYLDISSIDNSTQRIIEPKEYIGAEAPSRARQVVREGDILFSTVRTYLKKIALVPENYDGQIASTGFSVLRGTKEVLPKFLFYYTLTDAFLEPLNQLQRGTSYPAVRDNDVRSQPFPLPPLPEQERIVAKIEALFSQLDAGVVALKRIQAGLKGYKASVLKAACEGRLVPQDPTEEPAEVLLSRIRKKPIVGDNLPTLPRGWCWAKLSDIGANVKNAIVDGPFGSMLKVSDYVENGGIPVLTISNIDKGYGTEKLRFITEEKFKSIIRSAVKPGDILVAKIGASYGKAGIYPNWMPTGVIPANLLKISVHEAFEKNYIYYYLVSMNFKNRLDKITKSTAQPAFNVSMFRELPIPLPPIGEQHRIAAEVERQISLMREVEAGVEVSRSRSESLRQAILSQAFEGRLLLEKQTLPTVPHQERLF